MSIFKRWPKGAKLEGYFQYGDHNVRVALRDVRDLRDPAQKGPAPCRMLARLKIQSRIK